MDRLLKLLALGSTCRITQDEFPVLAPRFLLALAALGAGEMRTSQTPGPLRLGLRHTMEPPPLAGRRVAAVPPLGRLSRLQPPMSTWRTTPRVYPALATRLQATRQLAAQTLQPLPTFHLRPHPHPRRLGDRRGHRLNKERTTPQNHQGLRFPRPKLMERETPLSRPEFLLLVGKNCGER